MTRNHQSPSVYIKQRQNTSLPLYEILLISVLWSGWWSKKITFWALLNNCGWQKIYNVEEYISPTLFIDFLSCLFLLGPLELLERFDCRLFSKLWTAIWFKLSPSIVLAILYLMSKICEWAILVTPKKVDGLFRVFRKYL